MLKNENIIPMVDPNRDDKDLVARMLAGDERAFDTFVEQYYPRLYRFAHSRLGSDRDATQDIVQGTFEKVISKISTYRGEASLFTWMCTFCRFEIAAYWRQRGRRAPETAFAENSPAVRSALETLSALQEGPDAVLERKDLARMVRVVLDHLPIRYGNALEWKYLGDASVREIAARLELSPKAAESLLTRARRAFHDGFLAVAGG